jgi:hypothetical protein
MNTTDTKNDKPATITSGARRADRSRRLARQFMTIDNCALSLQ